jgi:hypothetical protein
MTTRLSMPPSVRARRSFASSSSVEVITPENLGAEETGAREEAGPPRGQRRTVGPRMADNISVSFFEIEKDFWTLLQAGGVFDPIDAGVSNQASWYQFRFALALSGVAVLREEEIRCYLAGHPDMLDPVEEVCRAARREFGSEPSLSLEVYCDPEIDDRHLVLYVRFRAYPPDTLRRIHSVSDAHENRLWDKSGSILVTTDFRPTR